MSLKRLISKQNIQSVLENILQLADCPATILDLDGKVLLGQPLTPSLETPLQKFSIEFAGEIIGWVQATQKIENIVTLINYIASQEAEKKTLARETLEKYKEITLLYKVSEKITANLDLAAVASLVLEEATKIIKTSTAYVSLLNPETQKLKIIAIFGTEYKLNSDLELEPGLISRVLNSGVGEIINDVTADPLAAECHQSLKSLICVPLKTTNYVIGVITLGSNTHINYTANDLKLLSAIASQASSAIENANLHANKLKEERIKSNLERYVSPQIVQAILEAKEDFSLQPVRKDIVILFSDIRNFTTQCEELPPEVIVNYLNEYFTHMVDVIFKHNGTVNKFVGDMIVALFGAPSRLIASERKAIEAAIEMQKYVRSIARPWIRENFHTGIGISSGKAVVGNIGSPQHMDYTAIGDEVNIASRLQSLARGGEILVSRSIYEATKDLFEFKEMGCIQVKGKKKRVEAFEVLY